MVGERASETKWTLIGSAAVGGSYAAAGVRTAWRRGRRRRDGTGSGEAGAQRASRRRRPRPVARRVGRSRLGGKCSNGAWRGRRGAATGRGQARARRRRRGPVAWCLRRADVARRVWWRGRRGTAAAETPLGASVERKGQTKVARVLVLGRVEMESCADWPQATRTPATRRAVWSARSEVPSSRCGGASSRTAVWRPSCSNF